MTVFYHFISYDCQHPCGFSYNFYLEELAFSVHPSAENCHQKMTLLSCFIAILWLGRGKRKEALDNLYKKILSFFSAIWVPMLNIKSFLLNPWLYLLPYMLLTEDEICINWLKLKEINAFMEIILNINSRRRIFLKLLLFFFYLKEKEETSQLGFGILVPKLSSLQLKAAHSSSRCL